MAKSEDELKAAIKGYIDRNGGSYPSWYVGIAADARNRLFNDHKVDEGTDQWIYDTASSSAVARSVENYFVATVGTDGGSGGGGEGTDMVYAYKKNSHINP